DELAEVAQRPNDRSGQRALLRSRLLTVDRVLGVCGAHLPRPLCIPHAAGHDGTPAATAASMIRWRYWVMWRRVCLLLAVGGCWSDDPLVDGELTAAQLEHFRKDVFAQGPLDPCLLSIGKLPQDKCDSAALLGQELFFDVRLSDAGTGSGGSYLAQVGTGKVSCASCHDPNRYFIDTRMPNSVSLGQTSWTKRNAMTVLDLHLKETVAHAFT